METKFIEATNGFNHGKFMVQRIEEKDWYVRSQLPEYVGAPLLRTVCGWTDDHVIVFDMQTGEGGIFRMRGNAHHDLDKHKIWVCPMFEPFLEWLLATDQPLKDLPPLIELPDAPSAMQGYRREGIER